MLKINLEPHARVHWLESHKTLRVEWLKLHMSTERFQEIAGQALRVLQEHKGSIWLADSYNSEGVFSQEIQSFMHGDDMTNFARQAGLRMILSVMPKQAGLASLSTKKWTKEAENRGDYIVQQFPDLDTCLNWVDEQTLS
ncbi:MAG: hypothetical protein R8G66_03885 [Cytophagales bacterium]|nr:hypothetical protein [Cytophagales bacterium]